MIFAVRKKKFTSAIHVGESRLTAPAAMSFNALSINPSPVLKLFSKLPLI
jgi:hypothetical protein